ncbi:MAG: ParB/RepB/Spo0J family partition protein [Candidatus Cryosericum sp.]
MKETVKPSPASGEASKNGAAASAQAVAKQDPDFIQVPFRELIVDKAINVRKTYRPERVAQLAEQIKADGMRRPLDVCLNKDGKYMVLAGFTRCAALEVVFGKNVGDYLATCRVNRSKVPGQLLTSEEMMMINLASDETQEPVKQSELAARVHYMVKEMGIRQEIVAKRCFVDVGKVGVLNRLWEKLHPEIKDAWTKAPSREAEIPLTHLQSWIAFPPDQQLIAFHTLVAPPSELDENEDDDGLQDPPAEKPPILWKVRPKKHLVSALNRLRKMQKEEPKDFTPEHEASLKTLRWALSAEGSKNRDGLQKPPY